MKTLLAVIMLCMMASAQDLKRPTVEAEAGTTAIGCVGTNTSSTAMANAHDSAGLTTSSTQSTGGTTTQSLYRARKFTTWQSASGTYTALTLNVNAKSGGYLAFGGDVSGNACLAYSINSGGSWTSIKCDTDGSGWSQQTFNISLSATQDLSKLQVAVCTSGKAGNRFGLAPGGDDVTIYDIWTLGTTSAAANGSGNGTGLVGRRAALVF